MSTPYSSRRSGKRPLVGTPPDSGTELHDLSARKPKRPNDDENLLGSPTKKLKRSPSVQLIVPFRERFMSQPEADRVEQEPVARVASSPAVPVSRRSASGEALLVPFRRSASSDAASGAPKTPGSASSRRTSTRTPVQGPAPASAPSKRKRDASWLDVVRRHMHERAGAYAALCTAGPPEDVAVVEQVEVDIVRTYLGDVESDVELRRDSLRRVLHAFCRHDAETGYVQGMDSIAAAALMPVTTASDAAAEELSFWWLVHVTSVLLKDYFAQGMPALWLELGVVRSALSSLRPGLVAHLDALGFDFALLAPGWYLTLFQRILDEREVQPALAALASATIEPTHLALGIVLACEEDLLAATDFDQAAKVLCGTVCASRTRRAPQGVLKHAVKLASTLPSAKLVSMRVDHGASRTEPETPRATERRSSWRRWW
jgi:hypothetical protein